ncbi:hypothetical protein [Phenylobacterium sp.]|uniref:hypothetical protein n=1 Tax=Phenylobacterium sp. TaxID=1871053 RepID=UPI002723ACE6|nr:hypothetical protein [Phenylobacterium sp.]MDO8799867.1 hypothetical protein [Phenylobacterium sp.]
MRDLRHAVYGMAIATVAGLILGGAAKPDLRVMTDLDGPQLLAGQSGERLGPGFQQTASWTSYGGQVPDYVIGTDWTQPDHPVEMAQAEPQPEPEPERVSYADPPVRLAPVKYESEPAPPPSYPSMGGDILAGLQAAHAPPPLDASPEEAAPPPA